MKHSVFTTSVHKCEINNVTILSFGKMQPGVIVMPTKKTMIGFRQISYPRLRHSYGNQSPEQSEPEVSRVLVLEAEQTISFLL